MKTVRPIARLNAAVSVPGSKSVSHRALIAAGLARGESRLQAFLDCEDTAYTALGLKELGIEVMVLGDEALVSGNGGEFPPDPEERTCFLGNSGTSFRLLLSIAALAQGKFLLTGAPRMKERPIGDLVRALRRLGVEASCLGREGFPPVMIEAKGIRGGKARIAGDKSSQYISSLLLAGPCMKEGLEIDVEGEPVSGPYLDVTVDVMKRFGIEVEREGRRYFRIAPGQTYQARSFSVDGDASSASYFWAAAAVVGGRVLTENIHPETCSQGDIGLLDLLQEMGCRVERESKGVRVQGGPLTGIEADMSSMPDMVPTLAAVALFADGKTAIRNVSHLRLKESDRLASIAVEWRRLGARVEELADGLIVHGGGLLSGAAADPHDDHRIAMSLAVIGLRVPGVAIENESCVVKSFPGFWRLWDTLG